MKVRLAEHAGYCFGVERAVRLALEAAERYGRVHTLGQLIHNPQEVELLRREGVVPGEGADEIDSGVVIIRSHGLPPDVLADLGDRGLSIIDATCPLVRRAQQLAAEEAASGARVVIVGDRDHAEVLGLCGHAGDGAVVVEGPDDLPQLPADETVAVISQTTQSRENLHAVIERLGETVGDLRVHDTICRATALRQQAAAALAAECDVAVVVGGRNSANTCRLASVCAECCPSTHHIETADEVRPEWAAEGGTVCLTAGASTPDWVIRQVVRRLEEL